MSYNTIHHTSLTNENNKYNIINATSPLDKDVLNYNYKRSSMDGSLNISNYNSRDGYGLVNAGLAVSKALGKDPYSEAPKLGGRNWAADMIKAPTAWQNGHTGQGIVVAVIDTGVDYNHQDLKNNIWTNSKEIAGNGIDDDGNGYIDDIQGWNFDNNNNNVLDNNGHGTHVSGTIAAENNGIGVTGIAYNSKIMAIKALDKNGSGSYSNISKGIYYAVDNGANIINLSLGANTPNATVKSAIEYASSKGVIVVMAAGNNSDSLPSYPARYAYNTGIAVGAVDQNNNLAQFSNRSGSQDITYVTAPGVDIESTVPNNKYASYSGTSMATPHIAGVVALMLSANKNLNETQIRQIITSTAANSNTTSDPTKPTPTPTPTPSQPGFDMPSLLPPLDTLLPKELINIGSQLPLDFPSQASIINKTPTPQPPSVVLQIGENDLKLRLGDRETPPLQISTAQYSIPSKSVYSFNQSVWEHYDLYQPANTLPQPEADEENDRK